MPFTTVKPIKVSRMNIKAIQQAIMSEMAAEGDEDAALYELTTKTWQHEKPTFKPKLFNRGNDLVVQTKPSGSTMGVNKYHWLDSGTSVRWAIMSSNWRSKTRSRYITSYKGAGKVLVVGKTRKRKNKKTGRVSIIRMKPQPGIKAREFSSTIQERRRPKFQQRMKDINKKAIEGLYG